MPAYADNAESVTRKALTAMSDARNRREPFVIFDARLHEASNRQLRLQGELSNALPPRERRGRRRPGQRTTVARSAGRV